MKYHSMSLAKKKIGKKIKQPQNTPPPKKTVKREGGGSVWL